MNPFQTINISAFLLGFGYVCPTHKVTMEDVFVPVSIDDQPYHFPKAKGYNDMGRKDDCMASIQVTLISQNWNVIDY